MPKILLPSQTETPPPDSEITMIRSIASFLIVLNCLFNSASAQGLRVMNGGNLVFKGAAQLIINNGGIRNDGNIVSDSSTVTISGNTITDNSALAGTSTTQFYNLVISKASNGTILQSNISVANNIYMNGGQFELNNFNINLDTTGTIVNETETNRITGLTGGTVTRQVVLNNPIAQNPGNIGVEITSPANMGLTTIVRGHVSQTNTAGTGVSINRYFDITPSNNIGLDATTKFHYFDAELNGLNENELQNWTSSDYLVWNLNGKDDSDLAGNWVTKNNVSAFANRTTLGSDVVSVLPITLEWFRAHLDNNQGILDWKMINNSAFGDYIEIERSATGLAGSFEKIGQRDVTVANGTELFNFVDAAPFNGATYYRLKMVQAGGLVHYSNVEVIYRKSSGSVNVYPNPATDILHVDMTVTESTHTTLQLIDMSGRIVMSQEVNLETGANPVTINLGSYASGMYSIHSGINGAADVKIIKK